MKHFYSKNKHKDYSLPGFHFIYRNRKEIFLFFFGLFLIFDVSIGDMAPENISEFVESDVSQEEAKGHINKHKGKYLTLGLIIFSLCLFIFYKGGGPASSSVTDFKAVHWGSDISSDSGSDISSDSGSDILSDSGSDIVEAAAPVIAAVAAGAAAVAPDIVVDPLLAGYIAEYLDVYAYARIDPVGYSLLADLWKVVETCFEMSEQSASACMTAREYNDDGSLDDLIVDLQNAYEADEARSKEASRGFIRAVNVANNVVKGASNA